MTMGFDRIGRIKTRASAEVETRLVSHTRTSPQPEPYLATYTNILNAISQLVSRLSAISVSHFNYSSYDFELAISRQSWRKNSVVPSPCYICPTR